MPEHKDQQITDRINNIMYDQFTKAEDSGKKFHLFQHCPDCGGKVKQYFFDAEYNFQVYKCTQCGKQLK